MLPSTFVSLLSSSECVSRGSGGGGTVGELAPSLLTAPWRKELLMLAGDVETNPGPYTRYVGKNSCDINVGSITYVAGLRGHKPPLHEILLHSAHHSPTPSPLPLPFQVSGFNLLGMVAFETAFAMSDH